MANRSAQLYNGDWVYVEKDSREITLTSEVKEKIDRIPHVVWLWEWTSSDALSATAWKELLEKLNNLSSMWKFLSSWRCDTWLPETDPIDNPHIYKVWDYYIISKVAPDGWTNYRPDNRQYTKWVASTVVEWLLPKENDSYYYDWITWVLVPSSWRTITVDQTIKAWSENPVAWWAVYTALLSKANISSIPTKLSQLSNIETNYQNAEQVNSAINQAAMNIPTKLIQLSNTETNFQNAEQVNTAITNATKNCVHKWDSLSLLDNSTTKYQTEAQVQAAIATWFSDGIREWDSLSKLDNSVTQYQSAAQVSSAISIATSDLVKASDLQNTYPTIQELNNTINNYHDSTKQDKLVSWTNIKTVNNISLLWSWNITIEPWTKVFNLKNTSDYTWFTEVYNYSKDYKDCIITVGWSTWIFRVTRIDGSYMTLSSFATHSATWWTDIIQIRCVISWGSVTSTSWFISTTCLNQSVVRSLPDVPNNETLYFVTA